MATVARAWAPQPMLIADAAIGRCGDCATRCASSGARLEPAERRRAVALAIDVWRDLGRDLAVAARGGARGVRDREQLDELVAGAARLDPDALRGFLDRLDGLMARHRGLRQP